MDKLKPTYLLKDVRMLIEQERYLLTRTSGLTSHESGYSQTEVGDVIRGLKPNDFYKSTTEFYEHTVWQDVYKPIVKGNALYVKFKITKNGKMLVITSFKEGTERILSQEKR